jgi:hypothetical protein
MHELGVLFLVNKEIRKYCMTFETSFMKVNRFVEKWDIQRLRIVVRVLFPVFDNSVVLFRAQKVLGYSPDPEITPIFCDIP